MNHTREHVINSALSVHLFLVSFAFTSFCVYLVTNFLGHFSSIADMRINQQIWLYAIANLIGMGLATPLKSPAMMGWESNFPYTYTPIYYTAEDVANWSPPSSDPSPDTSTGASPNPHHLTKRVWPYDSPFWDGTFPADQAPPKVGQLNCGLMLEACYQQVDLLPEYSEDHNRGKMWPHFACQGMLCIQTKKLCAYKAGWWCGAP